MTAILLLAHGARNPEWARPIETIAAAMRERQPQARVAVAYLDFLTPRLPEAVADLVGMGCPEIVVVPIFMANSGHTQRDLPLLLDAARARHPGLALRVAAPIGEAPQVVAAIAAYALSV